MFELTYIGHSIYRVPCGKGCKNAVKEMLAAMANYPE